MAWTSFRNDAIDAWIATHSVIGDMTDRVMWVSTAPHAQGAYRVVDMFAELVAAGLTTQEWRDGLAEGARAWERPAATPLPAPTERTITPVGSPASAAVQQAPGTELAQPSPAPVPPPRDLPAGDLVQSGEVDTVARYLALLKDAEEFIANDEGALAFDMARRAAALYPLSAEAVRLEGEALRLLGDEPGATNAFRRYFEMYPAIGPEYWRAKEGLEER